MKKGLHILAFIVIQCSLFAQPVANAGADFTLCPGESRILGGSPPVTGGQFPYTFLWQPSVGLSNANIGNPTVTTNATTQYTLTVTDANFEISTAVVTVYLDDMVQYTAGVDTGLCIGGAGVQIGNPINSSASSSYGFSWLPAATLSLSTSPNPIASPSITTIYSLTVTHGTCTAQTGTVKVTPYVISLTLAFRDTVILEGNTITLMATGGTNYSWFPLNGYIKYASTGSPDVNPLKTITYTVTALSGSCLASDTVRVRVIPSDDLVFYSAFTPNGDGDNDFFYIGNIQKYPDNILKIYNRYGQVIFASKQDIITIGMGTIRAIKCQQGPIFIFWMIPEQTKENVKEL